MITAFYKTSDGAIHHTICEAKQHEAFKTEAAEKWCIETFVENLNLGYTITPNNLIKALYANKDLIKSLADNL